jgi:hypothetical protein
MHALQVKLRDAATLLFSYVILTNAQHVALSLAPGLDFLTPTKATATRVELVNVAFVLGMQVTVRRS